MIHAARQRAQLPIHIIHTQNAAGVACFFVLRAGTTQAAQLKAKRGQAPVNMADYGEILASGYGTRPHKALAEELFAKYRVTFPI
jgi:hypothetical protein